MSSIERADWHYESAEKEYRKEKNLSDDSPLTDAEVNEIYRRAANHIGLFMNWLIDNDFIGEENKEEVDAIEAVKNGTLLGVDYFLNYCDGKFWSCDVREDILPFVDKYFQEQDTCYHADYGKWFDKRYGEGKIYTVVSSREDYLSFKPAIDSAYKKFKEK